MEQTFEQKNYAPKPNKPRPTLGDYVAIAIGPVLIMILVGSLTFFLLDLGYQGAHTGRMHWILFCFVVAITLIGRISIEQSSERAIAFGIALAASMGIVTFVYLDGYVLAWGLLAIAWWCTHKLTWDSTSLEEDGTSAGESLLGAAVQDDSLSDQVAFIENKTEPERREKSSVLLRWRERWTERKKANRRLHSPGQWVMYFCVAALPIFGLGQLAIASGDTQRRRYAFWLFIVYVAAGLGLLLLTSFLGLRRYLRQRKLHMPISMAAMWLGVGAAIIVSLLVLGAVMPRPSAEYSPLANVATGVVVKMRDATSHNVLGGDAGRAKTQENQQNESSNSQESQSRGNRSKSEADNGEKANGPSGKKSQDSQQQNSGGERNNESSEANGKPESNQQRSDQDHSQPNSPEGHKQPQNSNGSSQNQSNSSKQPQQADDSSQSDQKSEDSPEKDSAGKSDSDTRNSSAPQRPNDNRDQTQNQNNAQNDGKPISRDENKEHKENENKQGGRQRDKQSSPSRSSSQPQSSSQVTNGASTFFSGITRMFTQFLQWLKYGIVILVGLALLWTMREPIAAFLRELMELISELFGGEQQSETNTNNQQEGKVEEVVQHRRFSEFINPLDDDATNWNSRELIQYSFQALEAWAHDQGVTRQREQTSREFVESLVRQGLEFPNEARQLAKLHTQVNYSTQPLAADCHTILKSCWAMMSSSRLPSATSMESAPFETTSKEGVL